jgi:hypothetical protein
VQIFIRLWSWFPKVLHGEAKRCTLTTFVAYAPKWLNEMERDSDKEEVIRNLTHLACRRNGRCLDHPGRSHHSGMDATHTHSRLSHSEALWSPVCSYMQTTPACWHRCHHAHMEIPAHTHRCPHCSLLPCSHWHRSKCKSHWWGLCHRLHQHGMGLMCRHHPGGRVVLWHTDKWKWI